MLTISYNDDTVHMTKMNVKFCDICCAVCELKNPSMTAFLSGLEGSGWLKHISAILETSVFIANVSKVGSKAI